MWMMLQLQQLTLGRFMKILPNSSKWCCCKWWLFNVSFWWRFWNCRDGDNNSDHGDHTGDVLSNDIDTDTLTITEIRLATPESNFEATTFDSVTDVTYSHVSATSITGEYGTLTIGSDGSYEYAATGGTKNIDELDLGDTVKDYFQYKVNDGTNNSLGMITITIKGINDDPVGVNDTDTITYGDDAISVANTDSEALLFDDTDDDGDDDKADFTIHSITATTAGGSAQTTLQVIQKLL